MGVRDDEDEQLRSVAIQNAQSILLARQRAEQQLARSLAMMRATLESTTDAILAIDEAGRITSFNENFLAMWRLPREALASMDHAQVVEAICRNFADPDECRGRIEAIRLASPPESYDVLELADGRVFERFSRTQVVESRVVGRVWSFRDITQRRQAERALEDETRVLELLNMAGIRLAANLDLQTLLQAVTDAGTELSGAKFGAFFYNITDERGDSYALYTLSGAPREAFEGFGQPRATPLFGPTFRGEPPVRCDDVLQDPRYGKMGPHHGMPKGHLPVRSYLGVPVIARGGKVLGGLFFGHPDPGVFSERDERVISSLAAQAAVAIDNARLYEASRKAAEERSQLLDSERAARTEAERMSEMKDEFLATLSHELRTPLSAILGWAHVLRRRSGNDAELTRGLETIERNARVQAQLIEDLLDMSRITSGKLRLDIQAVNPAMVIEAAIQTVDPALVAKGIRLEKMLDPAAGPVSGDPGRLQQIVWNLLSNAVKFTPRDGKIQVVLERVDSHLEISVADTGVGIKPQFLPHVFERFRQADASTTRLHGGLGLGLSIVRNLTELHGGSVRVHSEGEGKGATFTVCLPLTVVQHGEFAKARRHPKEHGDLPAPFVPTDLSGIRIVVVDDQEDARILIKRVLEECSAEVLTAESAAQVLQFLETHRPQLLISDIGMPEVDGFELLRLVRARGYGQGGRVPAIALTAFARSEDRTRALRAGYLAHIAKPVEPAELIATVASVVGRTET